jgi:Transposase DDE domain
MISGIVASKSTQLPKVAAKVPNGTKPESRVKRFARWLDNERIVEEVYFLPYAEILLAPLALETLVLVMDGSVVGCGCVALMLHVLYKGRALPLAWRVRRGPKGHFPEALHIALVELVHACLPEGTSVVLLGDGEFEGTTLQQTLTEAGWR